MSHYAILRIAKHKTAQNLASSLKHNFREIPTHNANADITPNNGHFSREFATLVNRHYDCIDTTHKAMDWFNQRLAQIAANGKIRSNAVLAVEYLLTASPEWWAQSTSAQRNEWRKRTVDFLVQKHGAENIIAATYQVDETTPHISAFVIPEYRELAQLDKQKNDFLQQYRRQIDEEVLSRTQELSRNLNNARWENQKLFNEINGKNEMIAEQKQILTEQEWEMKRLSAEISEQERIIAEHKQAFDDLFEKLKATQIELNRYKEKYEPQQKTFGMDF